MSEFLLAFIAEQAGGVLHFWAVAGEGTLLSMDRSLGVKNRHFTTLNEGC